MNRRPAILSGALMSVCAVLSWGMQGAALAEDATANRGKAVFDLWCAGCHRPVKPGDLPVAGTSSLERTYKGMKPAALEQRTDLKAAYVKSIVRSGTKAMPMTRKTEISDRDLEALAAYLEKSP